jgi:eukaryotic-like serine/threonine-protein kinase
MAIELASENVRHQLTRVITSKAFSTSARSANLLRFLVEETLKGNSGELKEYTIGAKALNRGDTFDPRTDPIVRAEASRLRTRLALYYSTEGPDDPVIIALPKGSYVPLFEARADADRTRVPFKTYKWKIAAGAFGVIAVIAVSLLARGWTFRSAETKLAPLSRFEMELRTADTLGGSASPDIAISADGSRLAFVAQDASATAHLYIQRLDEELPVMLEGTEGARDLFFSPDGQWIAFQGAGKLKKVPVTGGSVITLCDASDSHGGTWSRDGNIYAVLDTTGRLLRLPADGATPVPVAGFSPVVFGYPQFLEGSNAILITTFQGSTIGTRLEVFSLKDRKSKVVVQGGTYGRYLANGYLVYLNNGTLFSVAFDPDRLETRGVPVAVLNDVAYSPSFGYAHLAFSETGTAVYRRSTNLLSLNWLDSSGRTEPVVTKPARYVRPRISPDGRKLIYGIADASGNSSWIFDLRSRTTTRIASRETLELPIWTPDGRFLLGSLNGRINWLNGDGTGEMKPLLDELDPQFPGALTPDNRNLAYLKFTQKTGPDLWTVPLEATGNTLRAGKPEPFQATPVLETQAAFSPDGKWIAYNSTVSGSWEIYAQSFPRHGTPVRVSVGGGRIPIWSPTSHDLYYATERQRIMKVPYVIRGDTFAPSPPTLWTERRFADTGVVPALDLHPDGKRFLVSMPAEPVGQQQSANHITVLLHFSEEIQRKVATRP